jgi:hypothetical protein
MKKSRARVTPPKEDTVRNPPPSKNERERGGLSLAEIAKREGLSRERIRQIEVEALGKLRAALEAKGWTKEQARAFLAKGFV